MSTHQSTQSTISRVKRGPAPSVVGSTRPVDEWPANIGTIAYIPPRTQGPKKDPEALFPDWKAARGRIDEMGQTKKTTIGKGKNKKVILSTEAHKDVYEELEKVFTSLKKTLSAEVLMMPKVRPNSLVQVDTPDCSGVFVVDRMPIRGGQLC